MGRKKELKKQAAQEKKELKEKQKREKKALKKEGTTFKQSNTGGKRALAIILWLLIAFFFARGLISTFTIEDSESVRDTLDKKMEELTTQEEAELVAGTFAQSFVFDYFTFDSETEAQWTTKMQKYVADGLLLEQPTSVDSQVVNGSEVCDVTVHSKKHIDVDIGAKITTTSTVMENGEAVTKKNTATYIIRVPVGVNGEDCAVLGSPIFVANDNSPGKVKANLRLDGDSVDADERDKVKKLAESFFSAYYGTKPSELKYYITKDFGSNATIGGLVTAGEITHVDVVMHGDEYEAKVTFNASNGVMTTPVTYYLTVVEGSQNRLYVSELSTVPK